MPCLTFASMNSPLGKVYAFDFDGTLSKRDTLLEFMRFVKGDKEFLRCAAHFASQILLSRLRLYPTFRLKRMMFARLFKGMRLDDFNAYCLSFSLRRASLIRRTGRDKVRQALAEGCKVVIISPALDNIVVPFCRQFTEELGREPVVMCGQELLAARDAEQDGEQLPTSAYNDQSSAAADSSPPPLAADIIILGTALELDTAGPLTGRFTTKKCHRQEKLRRLLQILPNRKDYYLLAYGNDREDFDLLDFANENYYRRF